jgi:hypothetical protein
MEQTMQKLSQRTRIFIALGILALVAVLVLGVDALRRNAPSGPALGPEPTLVPGGIPIKLDGRLVGSFTPADLNSLKQVSFTDPAEGVPQEGWLLRDIIALHVDVKQLKPDAQITVSSSSRKKSALVTWAEADNAANLVMFDLSNRGTLKLVSLMEKLSTRDQWVQDTDKIEIVTR